MSRFAAQLMHPIRQAVFLRGRYVKSLAWNLAAGAYYSHQSRELFAQLGERAYRDRARNSSEILLDTKILATIGAIHKKLLRFEHRVQRLKKLIRRSKGAHRVGHPIA